MSRAIRIGLLAIAFSTLAMAQSRNAAPPPLPNGAQLLGFLNQTVGWYGRLDAEGQLADQPTDVLYVNDDRQIASQAVARSFEFAKAYAPLLTQEVTAAPAASSSQRHGVFADYGDAVQRQHREMERMLRLTMPAPHPQSRLRVAANGVEVTIRYPVELERATEIDDRITSAVTAASGAAVSETE